MSARAACLRCRERGPRSAFLTLSTSAFGAFAACPRCRSTDVDVTAEGGDALLDPPHLSRPPTPTARTPRNRPSATRR